VSTGDLHTCAVLSNGAAKCWGRNNYGQLGDGTVIDRMAPVPVTRIKGVGVIAAISFSSAGYSAVEGAGSAQVTIKRMGDTTGSNSVTFRTANGTATAGSDYTSVSRTVSFSAGESSKTISIPIREDTLAEGSETVQLSLSNPSSGASLGSPSAAALTIQDNGATSVTPVFSFSAAKYSVGDAKRNASIAIRRRGNTSVACSVRVAASGGTATGGSDYTAVSKVVSFAAGETSKTVSVPITDDKSVEGNETVGLALSSPSTGAVLGSPSTATLTITDNDAVGPSGHSGKIASAKLTKKNFKRARARKVELVVVFSPASAKFNYVLSRKMNGKWRKVKSVKRTGTFTGIRKMKVKSLFKGKAIKRGRYRLKLSADANRKVLRFRVT
jgi:hypothetical protein